MDSMTTVRRRIVPKFKQSLNQSIFMSKGTFLFSACFSILRLFTIRKYPYIYIQQFISNPPPPINFLFIQDNSTNFMRIILRKGISNIKIYANYAQMEEVKMKNNKKK